MPSLTATDVSNRALDLIGTQAIQNIYTDTTKEALVCRRNYDMCRRAVLRMHFWNFALKRDTLSSPDPIPPIHTWTYRYRLPLDFLRMKKVDDGETRYRIENAYLVTNDSNIEIEYVSDYQDVDDFDALFFDMLSQYMAWVISYTITQSSTVKEQVWKDFVKLSNKAKFVDSTEDPHMILDADEWQRSRLGPNQGFVRDPMTDNG